mgnify:CR=1 FL=1
MKRALLIAIGVALLHGGVAFANGQSEERRESWQEYHGGEWQEVTMEGRFTLFDGFPALETEDGTYTLGAPRAAWVSDRLEEGAELEIEGYLVEEIRGPRGGWTLVPESVEGHVRVTEATLAGKTYVFDFGHGPMGHPGMGRGWGRHHGYGRHGYGRHGDRPGPGTDWRDRPAPRDGGAPGWGPESNPRRW